MSIKRIYCEKLPVENVISEIRECSGSQFDPEIARVFIDMLAEKTVAL
jgi:HD-GYP domain-containing protein (c-di-GMP phosphodiesterase class II)